MGSNSNIEWTDATWNPWQGCTKVSEACAHCYMFTDMKRYGKDPTVVRKSKDPTFFLPMKRRRTGEYAIPPGHKVFTCSWSDWFHERADAWRPKAWSIIQQQPDLVFQIVTKRPERIGDCLPPDWGDGWENVWLITTIENQHWANVRIPQLLQVPAAVRGLSIEPLLGPVDLSRWLGERVRCGCGGVCDSGVPCPMRGNWQPPIRWVIVGGESGHHARPCNLAWIRSIVEQCKAAGVPCFVKQLGSRPFDSTDFEEGCEFTSYQQWVSKASSWLGGVSGGGLRYKKPEDVVCVDSVGRLCLRGEGFMRADQEGTFPVRWHYAKKLRDKKGGDWNEWSEDLRVREFPQSEVPRA
jgi:protein gp37